MNSQECLAKAEGILEAISNGEALHTISTPEADISLAHEYITLGMARFTLELNEEG